MRVPCRGQQLKGMSDAEVLAHMNEPSMNSPVKQGWYHNPGTTHGVGKVGKVMHEFKEGELRSGSKHGPVVRNRKQAIAIAMSEAGVGRKKKGK